jgi:hypothetical protein
MCLQFAVAADQQPVLDCCETSRKVVIPSPVWTHFELLAAVCPAGMFVAMSQPALVTGGLHA